MNKRNDLNRRRALWAVGFLAGIGLSSQALSADSPEASHRLVQLERRVAELESSQSGSAQTPGAAGTRDVETRFNFLRAGNAAGQMGFWPNYWERQASNGN